MNYWKVQMNNHLFRNQVIEIVLFSKYFKLNFWILFKHSYENLFSRSKNIINSRRRLILSILFSTLNYIDNFTRPLLTGLALFMCRYEEILPANMNMNCSCARIIFTTFAFNNKNNSSNVQVTTSVSFEHYCLE